MRSRIKKVSLIAYIVLVIAITQLPINVSFAYIGVSNLEFNFTPFYCMLHVAEIFNEIIANGLSLKDYFLRVLKDHLQNFILNILLFFPFGCLLTINIRKSNVWKVMLGSFLFSLALETLQVIEMIFSLTHGRAFDIDDMIANTIGGILGFFFVILWTKMVKSRLNSSGIEYELHSDRDGKYQ